MRAALFLGLAMIAFVGAALTPGGAIDSATGSAVGMIASEAGPHEVGGRNPGAQSKDPYASWVAGAIELPRHADGHFYAEADVNGAPVNFLVDTGASMVALTGEDARAVGISWSDADIRPVARGASGPVFGVAVKLDSVALGGHEARELPAIVVPEGLGISLLGQSFLAQVEPVRIDGETMVLGE